MPNRAAQLTRLCVLVLAAACCAGVVAQPASAALTTSETLFLDTHESPSDGMAGPVSTTDVLASGQYYAAVVSGDMSAFIPKLWSAPFFPYIVCGVPQSSPAAPSPGSADTQVGQDAEVIFARPWQRPCPLTFPRPATVFQVDLGSGFSHPTANGAPFAAPTSDHTYTYLLQGQGQVANFGQVDTNTTDNNGVYTIVVRPATVADCNGNAACLQTASQTAAPSKTLNPLVSSKTCASRRRFRIHLVSHRHDPIIRATIRVNRKTVKILRRGKNHRLASFVDLRGLPRGAFVVQISARTKKGKTIVGVRRYHTCTVRRPGGRPPV